MLPLSEELAQALRELETWFRLHKTDGDDDLGVWRALGVVDRAQRFIAKAERS